MAVGDSKAMFQREGVRLAYKTSVTATESTAWDYELRESSIFLPRPQQSLNTWGLSTSGIPGVSASQKTLGRVETDFQIVTPFTPAAWTIFGASLLQSVGVHDGTKHTIGPYTVPIQSTPIYLHMEGGIASSEKGVHQVVGAICTSLGLSIPPVGSDLGRPMITAGFMAANAADIDDFSASSVTATDTAEPFTTSDITFKLDTTSKNFVGGNITIANAGSRSPNNGTTPDAMFRGMLTVTGDITVMRSGATSDEYDLLLTAAAAKTVKEVSFVSGSPVCSIAADVNILPSPTDGEQNGMGLVTFPFEYAYVDTSSIQLIGTIAAITWS
ncbi:MAG: hypothetical protein KC729_00125 [Candidatus Eisenbacteria bacterium]|uniref:Uncharacterized protein n=1 Tax=Eiseniibacteriota bacterium TaxID=2212470 RepID=A0A956RM49_UNCEI|nr:hypothetical protein [Candidatus Eisenbacteria bacterium]